MKQHYSVLNGVTMINCNLLTLLSECSCPGRQSKEKKGDLTCERRSKKLVVVVISRCLTHFSLRYSSYASLYAAKKERKCLFFSTSGEALVSCLLS